MPSKTIRFLLGRTGRLDLVYTGFAMQLSVGDGARFVVERGDRPATGHLVLCDLEGSADILRALRILPDGSLVVGLDSCHGGRGVVPPGAVLGIVRGGLTAGGAAGRLIAVSFGLWSRFAQLLYWLRKIREAPDFGDEGTRSIERKYQEQVESYVTLLEYPLGDEIVAMLARHFPPRAALLVVGSGAGREALHLAREGYRITGIDLVPEMVQASRRNAESAGLEAEFLVSDMTTLDLPGRRFDGAYITPLVYSFVPGRQRRIQALRRLGMHLHPGGRIVYSAHLIKTATHLLRAILTKGLRVVRRARQNEFGDWYTWFLTPRGDLGTAFSHRFLVRQVLSEARAAGYRLVVREGAGHFVAGERSDDRLGP